MKNWTIPLFAVFRFSALGGGGCRFFRFNNWIPFLMVKLNFINQKERLAN